MITKTVVVQNNSSNNSDNLIISPKASLKVETSLCLAGRFFVFHNASDFANGYTVDAFMLSALCSHGVSQNEIPRKSLNPLIIFHGFLTK